MRLIQSLFFLLLSGHISLGQVSDTPDVVAEANARQHLLQSPEPTYPAIAQAARIQGDVAIAIVIDPAGQVALEKVVSGPPMLLQAALDAVKKWKFTPFKVNDVAIQVSTTLTIPFHLDKAGNGATPAQEKEAQAWFPISDKCRNSLRIQNTEDALDFCKHALDIALQAGDMTSSDQLALLESHQAYGHALLAGGKLSEALVEEDKAVEVAKAHLKDTDQEYAMPFFWRAMVEERLGQGEAASADLTIAEETHRRAIAHLPDAKKMYSGYLASILKQHAALLDQMGEPAEAAKLRAEAASL
jgi:TonB family protein